VIKKLNVKRNSVIVQNSKQNINKKQYFDILLLLWLDGIHDKYVVDSFEEWYGKQTSAKILNKKVEFDRTLDKKTLGGLFGFLDGREEYRKISNAIKMGILTKEKEKQIKFPTGWERGIKDFLIDFYKDKQTGFFTNHIVPPDENQGIALAIDQQYSTRQEQPLTRLIDGTKVVGLITMGQALDPGSTMLPGLITTELQTALKSVINLKNNGFDSIPFEGQSKYALFGYEHILKVGGESVFHLQCSDNRTRLPNLIFNGNSLNLTQTAGKARKAINSEQVAKISKYFGDAFQYLLFTHLSTEPTLPSERGIVRHMFLGSGDSMMLLGYKIFCDIEGVQPHMIIDDSASIQPRIHAVNLPRGFKLKINLVPSASGARSHVTTQVNNNGRETQSKSKRFKASN